MGLKVCVKCNMNNRICPCKEMSFSIYNYKHAEMTMARSFSYPPVVSSTQYLLPFSLCFSIAVLQ